MVAARLLIGIALFNLAFLFFEIGLNVFGVMLH